MHAVVVDGNSMVFEMGVNVDINNVVVMVLITVVAIDGKVDRVTIRFCCGIRGHHSDIMRRISFIALIISIIKSYRRVKMICISTQQHAVVFVDVMGILVEEFLYFLCLTMSIS